MTTLLGKLRTLDSFLRKSPIVDFKQTAETLGSLVDAKVYILDIENKILGCSESDNTTHTLPKKYDTLLPLNATLTDIVATNEVCSKFPMYAGETNIGAIVAIRPRKQSEELSDEEIIILENAAHIIGLKQECCLYKETAKTDQFDSQKLRNTLKLLSYSEQKAVFSIFRELKEPEGILVTSKIADEAGLARSLVINAIRKLQSAALIQARSLGMKGTFIKVSNPIFFKELKKIAEEKMP